MEQIFAMFKNICFIIQFSGVIGLDNNVWKRQCLLVNTETIQCTMVPKQIPTNITRVSVEVFGKDMSDMDGILYVDSNMFSDVSWKNVKFLSLNGIDQWFGKLQFYFTDKCFVHLTGLEELRISVNRNTYIGEVFYGLNALSVLNLSGCKRFTQDDLEKTLINSSAVPNLNYLDISNIWNSNPVTLLNLDQNLLSIIFSKPIKGLNLSFNQILFFDGSAMSKLCGRLDFINISNCIIAEYKSSNIPLCNKIGVLDVSYSNAFVFPKNKIKVRLDKDSTINREANSEFTTIDDIRFDGNIKGLDVSGGALLTVNINNSFGFSSTSLRHNKITRFDIKLNIPAMHLTRMDLSWNGLEFINPQLFYSSRQTFDHFELSNNNLYLMVLENEMLFSQIAGSYPRLKYIGLAANRLSNIPEKMFKNNHYLEVVDLSNNKLTRFVLRFSSERRLKEIYLHNNNIHTLDAVSMQCLDALISINNRGEEFKVNATLDSNPISCSKCDDYEQNVWLIKSSVIILSGPQAATCINSEGGIEHITQNTVDSLQDTCNQIVQRRNAIIFSSTFTFILLLICTLVAWFVRRHRKRMAHQRNMEKIVALIQEGAEEYEFTTFLSYCNEDELFVNNEVFDPLQTTLQELTNTDRPLICTGDVNYHIGQWIAEETIRLLKRSSVVIIVVSNAYCQSRYCMMEFEQAYDLQKPIVLMFKGHVDEDIMLPVMRDLYNRYTRILWAFEDGEYRLKTTWQNVGTSILEMMVKEQI